MKLRNGELIRGEKSNVPSFFFRWSHTPNDLSPDSRHDYPLDIIAYRIIEDRREDEGKADASCASQVSNELSENPNETKALQLEEEGV